MQLSQVLARVPPNQEMAYIKEGMFHFIVLTRSDNTWDEYRLKKMCELLDKIAEESNGEGVLVTIGTGKKTFSSGFDLKYWMADFQNVMNSLYELHNTLARLMEFPMPSICVFNGTAIAGGYLLGLAHDFRIMHESIGNICLSELAIGFPLPVPLLRVCKGKLTSRVVNKILFGDTVF